jgi:hypothetical protein
MSSRLVRAAAFAAAAIMAWAGGTSKLVAQEAETYLATVQVRQIEGSTLHLALGTRHGLATGDILQVQRGTEGPVVGELQVTTASAERSVLTYAGKAMPVTRGETLTLSRATASSKTSEIAEAPETPAASPGPEPARAVQKTALATSAPAVVQEEPAPRPPAFGRWTLDLTARRSSTTTGGADPVDVDRTYATPALRLDATVPDAVAGFRLRTNMRLAYRYSDPGLRSSEGSARIYHASLERTFAESGAAPLRVALGRFLSPLETYSGYWDGLMLRVGPKSFGVAALVGYEPSRYNESLSSYRPKASAVVDGDVRGTGWRWSFDASAHTVRPTGDRSEEADHTFLGLSQRFSAGSFYGSQDLQLDKDPRSGDWEISELRLRGSLRVSRALSVRGGFQRRLYYDRYYVEDPLEDPFGPKGDRVTGGLSLRSGGTYVSADLSRNTAEGGDESTGLSGSISLPSMGGAGGPRLTGSASYWDGDNGTSTTVSPSLVLYRGQGRLRFGYRLSQWDMFELERTSHALDASLNGPLPNGYRGSVRILGQWGGGLEHQSVRLTLSKAF